MDKFDFRVSIADPLFSQTFKDLYNTRTALSLSQHLKSHQLKNPKMSLLPYIFTVMLLFVCTANALWCDCVTNRGDPFRDLDQTYSVCAGMPGAEYVPGNLIRSAKCDVGPSGSSTFQAKCQAYGSDTTAYCN
ncbi:hypothetical protein BGZ73_000374 [Actinomortierella ambigua]|nr:hypothetical protein BGZ73_000374 [Actinomortierella ambigua]